MRETEKPIWMRPTFIWMTVVTTIIFIILVANITVIESGEVGIKKVGGKYDKQALGAGVYWTPPWVSVEIVDAHQHAINYIVSKGDRIKIDHDMSDGIITVSSIPSTDKRGMPVDVDITVRYQINQEVIPTTIAKYGRRWEEMLVNPTVRDSVRDVIAHYAAEDIPVSRADIGNKLDTLLREKIEKFENKPIFYAGANLREVKLPKKINDNILRVQEARQKTEQAIQATALAKQEALRKKAIADGERVKKQIEADAQAYVVEKDAEAQSNATLLKANAQAEANKKLANSLTPELLELKTIQAKQVLFENPALKIVPESSTMLFGDIFKK